MRHMGSISAVVGVLLLSACDKEEQPEPANQENIVASAPIRFDAMDPALGGTVTVVGNRYVELRPEQSGAIDAMVYDQQGKPLGAEAKLDLQATVKTQKSRSVTLPLKWDPTTARYQGEVDAELGPIVPGPVQIKLEADGKTHTATTPTIAVIPPPQHGGTLVAAGDFSAEIVPTASGDVYAYVNDAHGKPVTGDAKARFYAAVSTQRGEPERVDLIWNPKQKRYVGRVDAKVTIVPGPVVFVAEPAPGRVMRGSIAVVAIAPRPAIDGSVVLVGDHSVEVRPVNAREIEAVVVAPGGALVSDPKAEVIVDVHVSPTVVHHVPMVWHAGRARYVGTFEADVAWGAPFQVRLHRHGHYHVGAVYAVPAIAAPHAYAHFEASLVNPVHMHARADFRTYHVVRPPHAHASFHAVIEPPHLHPPSVSFSARAVAHGPHLPVPGARGHFRAEVVGPHVPAPHFSAHATAHVVGPHLPAPHFSAHASHGVYVGGDHVHGKYARGGKHRKSHGYRGHGKHRKRH